MVRKRPSKVVRRIKQQVQDGEYMMTDHAIVEMDGENVSVDDVISSVVQGELKEKQTGDPRGSKYVFKGEGVDGRPLETVCRPTETSVRIITTYRVE